MKQPGISVWPVGGLPTSLNLPNALIHNGSLWTIGGEASNHFQCIDEVIPFGRHSQLISVTSVKNLLLTPEQLGIVADDAWPFPRDEKTCALHPGAPLPGGGHCKTPAPTIAPTAVPTPKPTPI